MELGCKRIGFGISIRLLHAPILCILLLLSACAGPSARFDSLAEDFGFTRHTVRGGAYSLAQFTNNSFGGGGRLHLYLGGDGVPWIRGRWLSSDPTPGDAVGLRLMALDRMPSVYLGRPCYHGSGPAEICDPVIWTQARYSQLVVESLYQAVRLLLAEGGYSELVLIGYSGGGALAMLLAPRFPEATTLVTIAGNLDIDAWTSHHGYLPLDGSLNPTSLPRFAASLRQIHLIGMDDTNIPPWLSRSALRGQPAARIIEWPGIDHGCCWERVWPEILACIDSGCAQPEVPSVR